MCARLQPPAWCGRCRAATGTPREAHDVLLPQDHDRDRARKMVPSLTARSAAILDLYRDAPAMAMGGRDLGYVERLAAEHLDPHQAAHVSRCLRAVAAAERQGEDDGEPPKKRK